MMVAIHLIIQVGDHDRTRIDTSLSLSVVCRHMADADQDPLLTQLPNCLQCTRPLGRHCDHTNIGRNATGLFCLWRVHTDKVAGSVCLKDVFPLTGQPGGLDCIWQMDADAAESEEWPFAVGPERFGPLKGIASLGRP